ncbi:acyltransferase domain-containing protein, partial [Myxococcota bacterium]|nr:acyltransferase domain-containing protein [Myxococcota bacterium]
MSRKGRCQGHHHLGLTLQNLGNEPKVQMNVVARAPKSVYICPGQGVQKRGMHLEAYKRSPAARAIWEEANSYTRDALGFSLLHIVNENPTQITINGQRWSHALGVLNLTQFTQVALVVLACAQIAELKEAGAFIDEAAFSGHSLGEYSSLSAIGGILSLENVVKTVYQRGLTMQNFVPRDEQGRSDFRMGVIRPHHAGISEEEMVALVSGIAAQEGHYIEIVNHNCRGIQYAVTGYEAGLELLRSALGSGIRGKAPYVEVPGIDVPFHSSLLKDGVRAFRRTLEEVFPLRVEPGRLVGKYFPNLTGEAFSLSASYLKKVFDLTQSSRVAQLQHDITHGGEVDVMARTLLIELLAYQFASPVQWIKIQENLIHGGWEHSIEVGPGHQPTLSNLFLQTLRQQGLDTLNVYHIENDWETVLGEDNSDGYLVFPAVRATPAQEPSPPVEDMNAQEVKVQQPAVSGSSSMPSEHSRVHGLDPVDLGVKTLLAYLAGAWPGEIARELSIEQLLQGNSARRNQMLAEVKKEFSLTKTDGLADLPLPALTAEIRSQTAGAYTLTGPVLKAGLEKLAEALHFQSATQMSEALMATFDIDTQAAHSVLVAMIPYTLAGNSRLTGSKNTSGIPAPNKAQGTEILEKICEKGIGLTGAPGKKGSSSATGQMVDKTALVEMERRIFGPDSVFMKIAQAVLDEKGINLTGMAPVHGLPDT